MNHKHIDNFNPDVRLLTESYQDFLIEKINEFDAGRGYETFNEFIKLEAKETRDNGEGVSYVVWNVWYDESKRECGRDIVAYYTLATTAIPYEDRIRLDDEEIVEEGKIYDIQICGIPAIEIKMFAVSEKYQDVFYEYEGEDLPVSAWIIRNIIAYAEDMIENVVGFKAIFLHAVPEAEEFYKRNGFNPVEINMKPLHSVDSEFTAMYLSLRHVHMNYEE